MFAPKTLEEATDKLQMRSSPLGAVLKGMFEKIPCTTHARLLWEVHGNRFVLMKLFTIINSVIITDSLLCEVFFFLISNLLLLLLLLIIIIIITIAIITFVICWLLVMISFSLRGGAGAHSPGSHLPFEAKILAHRGGSAAGQTRPSAQVIL